MDQNKNLAFIILALMIGGASATYIDWTNANQTIVGDGTVDLTTTRADVCLGSDPAGTGSYSFSRVEYYEYATTEENFTVSFQLPDPDDVYYTAVWSLGFGNQIYFNGTDYAVGTISPANNLIFYAYNSGTSGTCAPLGRLYIACYEENGTLGAAWYCYPNDGPQNITFTFYVDSVTHTMDVYNETEYLGNCNMPLALSGSGAKYDFRGMVPSDNANCGGCTSGAKCISFFTTYTTTTTTTTVPTTTLFNPVIPDLNVSFSEMNISSNTTTPCFSDLRNGSIRDAISCLYVGRNFMRDDGAPTMGYFFYLIVFGGMVFIFYLKHRNITVSGILMLLFLGIFHGEFPPEASIIYWGVVVSSVVVTLYGLFKNDD